MNQAFVNIGAYIAGGGVMIDGGSRVASCAQIGRGVKFCAGYGI
jgi:tetrahydrodipicolinate N-succinyltransferase